MIGIFKLSGFKDFIELLNIFGLCDRGYNHYLLIRPDDNNTKDFSSTQSKYRSPGEIVFSKTKCFSYAEKKTKDTPEIQAFNLMTIYNLVRMMIEHERLLTV